MPFSLSIPLALTSIVGFGLCYSATKKHYKRWNGREMAGLFIVATSAILTAMYLFLS